MSNASPIPLSVPLCGPADTMELIATGSVADHREWIYVVVHRSYGLWTHIYDVVELPDCSRMEIRLIRIMAGDRIDEARVWAQSLALALLPATANDAGGPAGTAGPRGSWPHAGLSGCRRKPV